VGSLIRIRVLIIVGALTLISTIHRLCSDPCTRCRVDEIIVGLDENIRDFETAFLPDLPVPNQVFLAQRRQCLVFACQSGGVCVCLGRAAVWKLAAYHPEIDHGICAVPAAGGRRRGAGNAEGRCEIALRVAALGL
jgi:hypothetical protein